MMKAMIIRKFAGSMKIENANLERNARIYILKYANQWQNTENVGTANVNYFIRKSVEITIIRVIVQDITVGLFIPPKLDKETQKEHLHMARSKKSIIIEAMSIMQTNT